MVKLNKLIVSGLLLSTALFTNAASAEIAVIVHANNANDIDAAEVKRIFLGKQSSFGDGSAAIAIDQSAGSGVVAEFNEKVLNRSASQLKAYWSKLIFTGKGQPPEKIGSDAEVLQEVAANPGAIGYIASATVDGSVRVLFKL